MTIMSFRILHSVTRESGCLAFISAMGPPRVVIACTHGANVTQREKRERRESEEKRCKKTGKELNGKPKTHRFLNQRNIEENISKQSQKQ